MPAKQCLQLRPQRVEPGQIIEAPQQLSAGLELVFQRMPIQLVEVMLTQLEEKEARRTEHACDREHEHQAQPGG